MKVSATETYLPLGWPDSPARPELRELLRKIRWSYSRRNVLEQCPRRYYYEYYAAEEHGAVQDQGKPKLGILKALQNRHQRIGSIAHLVISTYFRKGRSGELWAVDRLGRWARDIFRKDCAYSKVDPEGRSPREGKFPPTLLQEYYYRNPHAAALCSEAEERLVKALHAFAASSHFAEFRLAGTRPAALVERPLALSGLPCRATGKLDLAYASDGRVAVVDWKLGDPSGSGDDSLQLATYALWARSHFGTAPEAITVYKAHLTVEMLVQFPVTEAVLANGRARIIQDAERMAAVHDYGKQGIMEAFSACPASAVCALCPFQQICPEGRAVLHA